VPEGLQIAVKVVLLACLAGAAVVRHLRLRAGRPAWRPWHKAVAGLLALLALASYSRFDRFVRYQLSNPHDLYHYYLGSRYAEELGYHRLYHCTIVALDELGPRRHRRVDKIRVLEHYGFRSKHWFLDRPEECKLHFSAERWETFKGSVGLLWKERQIRFTKPLRDKGYNATPVWDLVGRQISSRVPLEPRWSRYALGLLDLLLVAGALVGVGLGLGWWAAWCALLFLGGCWELNRPQIRGAFLRLDWLACLLGSVALLHRGRHRTAGVLLAYAAMVRVFPAILLFGPGVIALREVRATRTLPRRHLRFFGAFAITCGLLFGATVVARGDLSQWRDFATKITTHDADHAMQRVGLKYALLYRGETGPDDIVGTDGRRGWRPHFVRAKRDLWRRWRFVLAAIALLVGVALGYVLPRDDDAGAVALSFPLVFVLVSPTFYYWCFLVAVVAVLAARAGQRPALLVLLGVVAANLAVFGFLKLVDYGLLQHFFYAIAYGALALYAIAVLWLARRGVRFLAPPAAPPPDPEAPQP